MKTIEDEFKNEFIYKWFELETEIRKAFTAGECYQISRDSLCDDDEMPSTPNIDEYIIERKKILTNRKDENRK